MGAGTELNNLNNIWGKNKFEAPIWQTGGFFIFTAPNVAESLGDEIHYIERRAEYKMHCLPLFAQLLLLFRVVVRNTLIRNSTW